MEMAKEVKAKFIEPMLLLRTDALPDDRERWQYELKMDGYRAIAFKTGGRAPLPVAQRQRLGGSPASGSGQWGSLSEHWWLSLAARPEAL
jgi:hypothetical protein